MMSGAKPARELVARLRSSCPAVGSWYVRRDRQRRRPSNTLWSTSTVASLSDATPNAVDVWKWLLNTWAIPQRTRGPEFDVQEQVVMVGDRQRRVLRHLRRVGGVADQAGVLVIVKHRPRHGDERRAVRDVDEAVVAGGRVVAIARQIAVVDPDVVRRQQRDRVALADGRPCEIFRFRTMTLSA